MIKLEGHISENLARVQDQMNSAAIKSGRDPKQVRLVAITKGQPADTVRLAYQLGVRDFGENRVEEGNVKISELADCADIKWHMVGHIQSRKAKLVPGNYQFVHSVDRMKIARALNRYASETDARLPIFIECNASGEATKSGWPIHDRDTWSQTIEEMDELLDFQHLRILGCMTMAPWVQDERILRECFHTLRLFQDEFIMITGADCKELSMGMTDDFPIAIEEGATVVRIGRAIFGERAS